MQRFRRTAQLLGAAAICGALVLVLGTAAGRSGQGPLERGEPASAAKGAEDPPLAAPPGVGEERVVERSPDRGGPYAAPAGTTLRFAVTARQESFLSMTGANDSVTDTAFLVELAGELELSVLDRRADESLLSLAYVDPQVSLRTGGGAADEEECSAVELQLARTVHLRMRDDGTVAGWSFPADMPPWARQFERGFLAQVRFVVPAGAGEAWTAEERDTTGLYRVEYRRASDDDSGLVVQRRRLECTPAGGDPDSRGEARLEDHSTARFDLELGWLVEADCAESMALAVAGAAVRVEAESRATWRLVERRMERASAEVALWELAWSDDLGAEDVQRNADEQLRLREEASIAGLTLENLLYDLEEALRAHGLQSREQFEARELLKSFLRLHPEEHERFAAYLSDGSLGEDAVGVALSALGSVGAPKGQRFLAEVLADPARTEKVRMLSLFALFQVAAPVPEVAGAIERQWQDAEASLDLRSTALLLLGRFAQGSEERGQALLACESRARVDGLLDRYVSALGNAHLFDEVEPYLQHDDPLVRSKAERALARRRP